MIFNSDYVSLAVCLEEKAHFILTEVPPQQACLDSELLADPKELEAGLLNPYPSHPTTSHPTPCPELPPGIFHLRLRHLVPPAASINLYV